MSRYGVRSAERTILCFEQKFINIYCAFIAGMIAAIWLCLVTVFMFPRSNPDLSEAQVIGLALSPFIVPMLVVVSYLIDGPPIRLDIDEQKSKIAKWNKSALPPKSMLSCERGHVEKKIKDCQTELHVGFNFHLVITGLCIVAALICYWFLGRGKEPITPIERVLLSGGWLLLPAMLLGIDVIQRPQTRRELQTLRKQIEDSDNPPLPLPVEEPPVYDLPPQPEPEPPPAPEPDPSRDAEIEELREKYEADLAEIEASHYPIQIKLAMKDELRRAYKPLFEALGGEL